MMRFFKKDVMTSGIGMVTGSWQMVSYIQKNEKQRQEWFKSLPEAKQKELYHGCPLQYVGSDLSAFSSFYERLAFDTGTFNKEQPLKPFTLRK